jgi:dolichol-phosphate mannosyltransferase
MTGTLRPGVSLVIPAFNEQAGISQAIAEADEALATLAEGYEILVVDDGSQDATPSLVAEECARRPHVRLLRHAVNQGYGAALRTGFEAASFDRVAFTDADCQFHVNDLARLLPLADTHPLVVGYRIDRQDPWRRRFLSRGYNLLVRTLLGTRVRDCDCALKVFRRDALARILPRSPGFFVNTEMLTRARQQGLAVAEVGVRHRPRLRGQSTVSLREVPRTLAHLLPFWWSEVMFPGPLPDPGGGQTGERGGVSPVAEVVRLQQQTPPLKSPPVAEVVRLQQQTPPLKSQPVAEVVRLQLQAPPLKSHDFSYGLTPPRSSGPMLLVLLMGLLLFLGGLSAPLLEPQEARYAEIPRQMLARGEWCVPTLHGQPYLDKPPLLYWLVMGCYALFGVHDQSARLVPGLAGVLTLLITYLWGRFAAGVRAGLCGALVLGLSAEFVYRQRMLGFDALLGLWVTAGLAAGHRALAGASGQRAWWLLSALFTGLGLLTKGPVALALTAVPLLALVCLDRRVHRPRLVDWLGWVGVALLVAGPWYVAVMIREPEFAAYFFWHHNVVRFVAPFDHPKPAWYYLPGLLLGLLPWGLLVPGFVAFLARRGARAARRRPAGLGFFLLVAGVGLAFFSASGCKRPTYILPVLPPLALALGCYLAACLSSSQHGDAWQGLWRGSRLATRAALLVLLAGPGLTLLAGQRDMLPASWAALLAGVAGLAFLVVLLQVRLLSWASTAGVVFAVLFLGVQVLLPGYNAHYALREPLLRWRPRLASQGLPILCYPQRWESVGFYLPEAEVHAFGRDQKRQLVEELRQHPEALLLVKSKPLLDELLHELRDLPSPVEVVVQGRPSAVIVARVRSRREAPVGSIAQRSEAVD